MGHLYYGTETLPVELPDRMLAHVKVVIATKLRRGESFMLTCTRDGDVGSTSLWMQPAIPLRFVFDSPEIETLDGQYLQELAHAANSSRGLRCCAAEGPFTELRQPPVHVVFRPRGMGL